MIVQHFAPCGKTCGKCGKLICGKVFPLSGCFFRKGKNRIFSQFLRNKFSNNRVMSPRFSVSQIFHFSQKSWQIRQAPPWGTGDFLFYSGKNCEKYTNCGSSACTTLSSVFLQSCWSIILLNFQGRVAFFTTRPFSLDFPLLLSNHSIHARV